MSQLIGIAGKMQHGKDAIATMIRAMAANSSIKPSLKDAVVQPWEHVQYNVPVPERWGKFQIRKFADTLKDMVCLLLKCTRSQLEDPVFKETPLGGEWVKYRTSYYVYEFTKAENEIENSDSWFATLEEARVFKKETEEWANGMGHSLDHFDIHKQELTPRLLLQKLATECGRDILHPNIWVLSTFQQFNDNSNWIISDVRFPNEAEAIKDRGGILIRVHRPGVRNEDTHSSEMALDDYWKFDHLIMNEGSLKDLQDQVENVYISSIKNK